MQRHFTFKTTKKLNIIEDHFGHPDSQENSMEDNPFEKCQFPMWDKKSDTESTDSQVTHQLDGLLVERNKHFCNRDNFEEKFKVLFGNK